jgi:hypothetical protein
MGKIKLKTGERKTTISREAVRNVFASTFSKSNNTDKVIKRSKSSSKNKGK